MIKIIKDFTTQANRTFYLIFYLSVSFLQFSCIYESELEIIDNINPPELKNYTIKLNPDVNDYDTIHLYNNTQFNFFITSLGEITDLKFLLNSYSVNSNLISGNTLKLILRNYGHGYHTLKINAKGYSGTGSLSDDLKREIIEFSKEVTLFFDINIPDPNLQIIEKDGFAKVIWNEYLNPNFEHYIIETFGSNVNPENKLIITDPKTNYYIDSLYFGQPHYYYRLTIANEHKNNNVSTVSDLQQPIFSDTIQNIADSTVTFTIGKSKYYNAISSFKINNRTGLLQESINKNKHSITVKTNDIGLGMDGTLIVRRYSIFNGYDTQYSRIKSYIKPNTDLPKIEYVAYNKTHGIYVGVDKSLYTSETGNEHVYFFKIINNSIYVLYDFSMGKRTAQFTSTEGDYFYFIDGTELVKVNLSTFQFTRKNLGFDKIFDMEVADNGLICLHRADVKYYSILFDNNSDKVLHLDSSYYYWKKPILTFSGDKYITLSDSVYNYSNGSLQYEGMSALPGFFLTQTEDYLVTYHNRVFLFYEKNARIKIRDIDMLFFEYHGYDRAKDKIIVSKYISMEGTQFRYIDVNYTTSGNNFFIKLTNSNLDEFCNGIYFNDYYKYLKIY